MEFLYEVLIRGDHTGVKGVHQILGRVVTDSDGESHVKIGKAEPVSLDVVAPLIGNELAKLLGDMQTAINTTESAKADKQIIDDSVLDLKKRLAQAAELL